MQSCDVLIVGAGPVGLTLALECCRHQIDFRIIDHHPTHSSQSKALVIWSGTLECLAAMGVVEQFLKKGMPVRRFVFADQGKILNEIPLTHHIDSPYPTPIFLPQSQTEEILECRLEHLGKKVERGVEFVSLLQKEEHVQVEFRKADGTLETCCVKYLAGCDGARSPIRHTLPVQFEGETESLSFVLVDAKVEGELPVDGMFASWGNGYTVIFFPVKPGVFRMFTQRRDHTQKTTPTLEEMQGYLSLVGLGHLRLYDPEWLSHFDINERVVNHNRVGRVFLLGDAAHIHSPAGGQGMNTGMQDAFNLGWKIKLLVSGQGDPTVVAQSYSEERHPIAKALVRETTKLLHFGVANTLLARLTKACVIGLLFRLPWLQKIFCEKLSEVNIHYLKSGLLEHAFLKKNNSRKSQVGWRVYETMVTDQQTQKMVSLWEQFLHPGHTLLIFAGDMSDLKSISSLARKEIFGLTKVRTLVVARGAIRKIPGVSFFDINHEAHRRFGVTEPSWFLIRPDLYVAARGPLDETTALESYFKKVAAVCSDTTPQI